PRAPHRDRQRAGARASAVRGRPRRSGAPRRGPGGDESRRRDGHPLDAHVRPQRPSHRRPAALVRRARRCGPGARAGLAVGPAGLAAGPASDRTLGLNRRVAPRPLLGAHPALTLAVLDVIGLAIATYLSVVKLTGGVPVCGPLAGCEQVALSEYS